MFNTHTVSTPSQANTATHTYTYPTTAGGMAGNYTYSSSGYATGQPALSLTGSVTNTGTISGYANSVLTTNGSGTVTWANNITSSMPSAVHANGSITVTGKDADIIINGVSLKDSISAIEQRLNILVPNMEIENEWAELADLGKKYRELEQHIKDKMDVWSKLTAPAPKIP